jgi:hypothetical protein
MDLLGTIFSCSIVNTTFRQIKCVKNNCLGGALLLDSNTNGITIDRCIFSQCSAMRYGAICIASIKSSSRLILITRTRFENNSGGCCPDIGHDYSCFNYVWNERSTFLSCSTSLPQNNRILCSDGFIQELVDNCSDDIVCLYFLLLYLVSFLGMVL